MKHLNIDFGEELRDSEDDTGSINSDTKQPFFDFKHCEPKDSPPQARRRPNASLHQEMLENLAEEESPLPVAEEKPQQADHFYDKFQAFLAKELIEQDGDTPFDEEFGDTFSDRFQAFLDQE